MYQDTYELPTVYRQKESQLDYNTDDAETEDLMRVGPSAAERHLLPVDLDSQCNQPEDRTLAWLLLATPLSMLIFTLVPVVTDFPNVNAMTAGDAIWRLFDPIVTLPLNLFLILRANMMRASQLPVKHWGPFDERTVTWLLWCIGAAIYVQGHGVHLAAALFKHPVEDFMNAHPELMANQTIGNQLTAIYLYMETTWEHYIAHYMYAGGALWMSWVQILFAFRDQAMEPLSMPTKVIFAIGSLVYGLLIAAVAIEFPQGLYVGLVYTLVLGLMCILLITLNRRGLPKGGIFTMGRRMVLQYYLGASIIALIIIIGWLAKYGFVNRKAAGIA